MVKDGGDANKNVVSRWFSRKRKPEPPASKPEAEQVTTASTPRKAYVPRYAARDMIMSMPIGERPDLKARASERQLSDVCSDIGFSTASPYSYRPSPTQASTARSIAASSTAPSSVNEGGSGSRAPSIGEGRYGRGARDPSRLSPSHQHYWQGYEGSSSKRPIARSVHSAPPEAGSPLDSLNVALRALDDAESDRQSLRSVAASSTASAMAASRYAYAPARTVHTERSRRPAYFSHHTIPNLRSTADVKGKGKVSSLYSHPGEARITAPSRLRYTRSVDPEDDQDGTAAYVLRTADASASSGSMMSPRGTDAASRHTSSNASFIESTTSSDAPTVRTEASKASIASSATSTAPTVTTEPSSSKPPADDQSASAAAEA